MKDRTDNFSFFEITTIRNVFLTKSWPIDERNKSSLFNRFLKTYRKLENMERDLFIKLSLKYDWVPLSRYQDLIITLLEKTVENHGLSSSQELLIYPIKKNKHSHVIKSSDAITYLCNSVQMKHSDILFKKKIRILSSLDAVKEKSKALKSKPLLLIDDFIGTGKYASEVIEELKSIYVNDNQIVDVKNIIVCSLFIAQKGIENLRSTGCRIEYIEVAKNVIEELTNSEKKLLEQIESKIVDDDNFRFGYGGAASLISLIRTPNNSLPVFWHEQGRVHSAPFPR